MRSGLIDIGEVRARTGLPASTLHYYERHGLIRSVSRAGLRRQFEDGTIERLAVISFFQQAGFRLEEIAELLAPGRGPAWMDAVRAKQADVSSKVKALHAVERSLSHALNCRDSDELWCEHLRADFEVSIPVQPKDHRQAGGPSPKVRPKAVPAAQHLHNLAWLRRVRDRVDREYAQPLDVEALARGVHMSAGHLSREFKLAYGESPYSYLMTRRIERAMALLRRGDLSVTEVCFAVGCSSLGTFSTRFTELVGMSPSAYRRQARRPTAGLPPCIAKQVTRPIRNREASGPEPLLP